MGPTVATIPARSERQAMDWSLVLVSQGIDTRIERPEQDAGWRLVVDLPDHERALAAIRQYRQENRRRPWVRELPWSGLIFDWRSLLWSLLLVSVFLADQARSGHWGAAGAMDNRAVSSGEWWRLFTAVTLHQDLPHLAVNVATGIALLGLAMGSFGPGVGLLAAYLAGVGGNVAGFFIYGPPHAGLGASGMVMGALGLLTGQSLALLRHGRPPRQLLQRGLLGGLFLFIFLGANPAPNTDMVAHVAGFVGGIVLGGALALVAVDWAARIGINRIADLFCYSLVILTWWLALR